MKTLIPILPVLLFVLVLVLLTWARTRKGQRDKRVFAPARRRKVHLLLLPVWLFVAAGFGWDWLHHRGSSLPWRLLFPALMMAMSGYEAFFRRSKPGEDLQNWACDTARCGRCEYDLTGNVSGICPECGMPIPASLADIQKPWWAAWWVQWRIDYLIDWRKTLAALIIYAVLFAALATWMAFGGMMQKAFAIAPGVICASMVINCVRVLQYHRRVGDR